MSVRRFTLPALCLLLLGSAGAQDSLTVGVKPAPPFVIYERNQEEPEGFSIDLIRAVGRSMTPPRAIRFHYDTSLIEHLETVEAGEADLGIAATTISAERERFLDFSQPFFEDYLGLLVRARRRGIIGFFTGLFQFDIAFGELYTILGGILIYLLICSVGIWLIERGNSFSSYWLKGIGQGAWWTIVTMSTVGYGDFVPKRSLGRIIGVIVVFSGIVLFGVAIASLSSMLTINQMQTAIDGVKDLQGKRIGVIEGSTSESTAEGWNARLVPVESLEEGVNALRNESIVAFMHDASLLRHYLRITETRSDNLKLIIEEDFRFRYGITFPSGSDLREPVNIALLSLMEGDNSAYKRLRFKWFGSIFGE